MQVVENMDAIARARVERPIRGAELAQTLENAEEHVVGGARPSQFPDSDGAADLQSLGTLACKPWSERSQFIILLMGQGGCGKTYVVQHFVARVVKCPAIRGF
jgi:hypothetical protein